MNESTYGFVGGGSFGATGDLIYWAESAALGSRLWIGTLDGPRLPPSPMLGQGETLEFYSADGAGVGDLFNTRNAVWLDGYLYVTNGEGRRIRSSDGVEWEFNDSGSQWPADEPADWPELWEGRTLIEGSGLVDDDTGETLIPPEAVAGMDLVFSEFGVFGVSTYDPEQVGGTFDAVFSADGTSWARWPLDFITDTSFEVVGIGNGFVVLSEWYSHRIWVAPLP